MSHPDNKTRKVFGALEGLMQKTVGDKIMKSNPRPVMGEQKDLFGKDAMLAQSLEFSNLRKQAMSYDGSKNKALFLDELGQWEQPKANSRFYIGIDNGVSGSIGMINADTGGFRFIRTPVKKELNYTKAKAYINRIDAIELTKILSVCASNSMVLIERPMVNPGRWVASVSAIRALEATQTVLEQLGLPYAFIDSKEWQKVLLPSGLKGEELKKASLDVGKRLFPNIEGKHADFDGMLLAEFCKRKHR